MTDQADRLDRLRRADKLMGDVACAWTILRQALCERNRHVELMELTGAYSDPVGAELENIVRRAGTELSAKLERLNYHMAGALGMGTHL